MKPAAIAGLLGTLTLGLSLAACVDSPPTAPSYGPGPYAPAQAPGISGSPGGGVFRQIFAGTLALVLQSTGAGAAASIAQGVSGSIVSWFSHRSGSAPGAAGYGVAGYATFPSTGAYPAGGAYPGTSTFPPPTLPNTTTPLATNTPIYPATNPGALAGTYPGTGPAPVNGLYPGTGGAPAPGGYPPTPGSPVMTDPTSTAGYASTGPTALNSVSAAIAPAGNNVYAGMAFEVHLLATSGTDTPIDPASYTFNTGDRFLVYYRPSLPGGVDVYNINPAGKTSHIDFVTVAAGQLATLGPYEFADTSGDEGLKFVLAPCSDAKLLATTRGIVRHAPAAAANQTEPGIALPTCGAHSTRGLTTAVRDIRKVGTEGGTTFALDPVSQQELQSGNVASRTVTITLHHH